MSNTVVYIIIIIILQIILECTGEAPVNATVTVQCNETGVVYFNTTLVMYAQTPINITGSVSVPQYAKCSLSVLFSNAIGSSEPLVMPFGECSVNTT